MDLWNLFEEIWSQVVNFFQTVQTAGSDSQNKSHRTAGGTRNQTLASCCVHVKCLLECHLHSFPLPLTNVNMQSELGSLNQIYQDRFWKVEKWPLQKTTNGDLDAETGNFVHFHRVIFIFDTIFESTNRHLDNPQLTMVMFCVILQTEMGLGIRPGRLLSVGLILDRVLQPDW